MQAAVSEERRAAAAAELASARARAADAAGDSGLAEEQAAVWEGRAVGLQARVRRSIQGWLQMGCSGGLCEGTVDCKARCAATLQKPAMSRVPAVVWRGEPHSLPVCEVGCTRVSTKQAGFFSTFLNGRA